MHYNARLTNILGTGFNFWNMPFVFSGCQPQWVLMSLHAEVKLGFISNVQMVFISRLMLEDHPQQIHFQALMNNINNC